jgi:hypothetical protein
MRLRFIIVLTFFLVSTFVRATELSTLKTGPDALDDHLGNGKWLIVMLWASDCVACNKEAFQYVEFHEFHHDIDAGVLGISLDGSNQSAASRFIDKHNIQFPNLITDFTSASIWFENLTGQQFWGTPGFLIYDPAGELRAQQIGAVPVNLIEDFIAKNSTAN